MILVVTAALGVAALAYSQGKLGTFKTTVQTIFSTNTNTAQESLVIENIAYHYNTQSFNITMTNTGYETINVTNVKIQGPTKSAFNSNETVANIGTPTISTKNCIINPGQSCTAGVVYHCFSDPVTISITTSRGTTLTKTSAPVVPWYNSNWQFRKEITIDNTKVASTLTNFPILINVTDTDLKNNALTDGSDILFTACDGSTKLNHEVENFTKSTGSLTSWVQVPTLYNTPNDIIYMYYGNSGATNQQNVAGTWNSNYAGVYHFVTTTGGGTIVLDNALTANNLPTQNNQVQIAAYKVGSGSNRLLLVLTSTDTVHYDSVKYGSTSLTPLVTPPNNPKLNGVDVEFWYLVNPPIGTNSITAHYTGGQDQYAGVGVYSFFGVDQTTPIANYNSASGTGLTTTVSLTNSYANSWVIDYSGIQNGGGLTLPTQTKEFNNLTGADSSASSIAKPTLKNIANIFSWTGTTSSPWAAVAVELKGINGPLVVPDSTSYKNDLSTFNIGSSDQVSSYFYNGLNFDGINKYAARTSSLNGMPTINGPQTGSIWFQYPSAPAGKQNIYSLQDATPNAVEMGFNSATTYDVWQGNNNVLLSTSIPTAGNWHYGVYTYDGTTHRFYLDGVQKTTSATSQPVATPTALYVGTYSGLTQYYKGKLDEFRYSTTTLSPSWILTEYKNEVSPSTFYTIGTAEPYTNARSSG